jgi:hypothetical protein
MEIYLVSADMFPRRLRDSTMNYSDELGASERTTSGLRWSLARLAHVTREWQRALPDFSAALSLEQSFDADHALGCMAGRAYEG